jgi:hypothetical protein
MISDIGFDYLLVDYLLHFRNQMSQFENFHGPLVVYGPPRRATSDFDVSIFETTLFEPFRIQLVPFLQWSDFSSPLTTRSS